MQRDHRLAHELDRLLYGQRHSGRFVRLRKLRTARHLATRLALRFSIRRQPIWTPSSRLAGATGFSPDTGSGLVQNALIDVATGQYATGVAFGALPTHTPLQGQFIPGGTVKDLTTGVDTVVLNSSNSTVNGTYGGAGAGQTWTAGDTITAASGTTGQTFNIDGVGTAFVLNVTSQGPGNAVSGVQTVNIVSNVGPNGVSNQAIQGDFTSTGPKAPGPV